MRDQPELTPELAQRVTQAIARQYAKGRKFYLETCYRKGAASPGRFERFSPYYEDPGADIFWYAGYDGFTFEEAVILHDAAFDAKQKGEPVR